MGKPEEDDLDDFDLYTVDGINAYVDIAVMAENDELSVILFNEKLVVEGMAIH